MALYAPPRPDDMTPEERLAQRRRLMANAPPDFNAPGGMLTPNRYATLSPPQAVNAALTNQQLANQATAVRQDAVPYRISAPVQAQVDRYQDEAAALRARAGYARQDTADIQDRLNFVNAPPDTVSYAFDRQRPQFGGGVAVEAPGGPNYRLGPPAPPAGVRAGQSLSQVIPIPMTQTEATNRLNQTGEFANQPFVRVPTQLNPTPKPGVPFVRQTQTQAGFDATPAGQAETERLGRAKYLSETAPGLRGPGAPPSFLDYKANQLATERGYELAKAEAGAKLSEAEKDRKNKVDVARAKPQALDPELKAYVDYLTNKSKQFQSELNALIGAMDTKNPRVAELQGLITDVQKEIQARLNPPDSGSPPPSVTPDPTGGFQFNAPDSGGTPDPSAMTDQELLDYLKQQQGQ